MMIRIRETIN